MNQGMTLLADMSKFCWICAAHSLTPYTIELGQYVKLPPRGMFRYVAFLPRIVLTCRAATFYSQVGGAVVGAVLNYVMLLNIIDSTSCIPCSSRSPPPTVVVRQPPRSPFRCRRAHTSTPKDNSSSVLLSQLSTGSPYTSPPTCVLSSQYIP